MDEDKVLDLAVKGSEKYRLLIFLFYLGLSFVLIHYFPKKILIFFPLVLTFFTMVVIDHIQVAANVLDQDRKEVHLFFMIDELFWCGVWLLLSILASLELGLVSMTLFLTFSLILFLFFRSRIQNYILGEARVSWKNERLRIYRKAPFQWDS